MDVQNPNPDGTIWLDAADTNFVPEYWYQTTAIQVGEYYKYVWEMVPTDYVFEEGHQFGIVIYGSDPRYTTRPLNATTFTVDLEQSYVELPLVNYSSKDYDFVIEDNKTQPFVDQDGLIHEELWIEAPTDTDNDGKRDLVYVKITRPGETEYGLKSPVIVEPTPYDSTTSPYSTAFSQGTEFANDWDWYNGYIMVDPDQEYNNPNNPDTTDQTYAEDIAFTVEHTYDEIVAANFDPDWLPAQRVAESVGEANRIGAWLGTTNWKQYFISRGYAVIKVNTMGDFNSEGLITVGDYNEALAMASVVDWLNGRVRHSRTRMVS